MWIGIRDPLASALRLGSTHVSQLRFAHCLLCVNLSCFSYGVKYPIRSGTYLSFSFLTLDPLRPLCCFFLSNSTAHSRALLGQRVTIPNVALLLYRHPLRTLLGGSSLASRTDGQDIFTEMLAKHCPGSKLLSLSPVLLFKPPFLVYMI